MKNYSVILFTMFFLGVTIGISHAGLFYTEEEKKAMNAPAAPAATTTASAVVLAVDGNCPVHLTKGRLVKGMDRYSEEYKGKKYLFDSRQDLETFKAAPAMYTKDLDNRYSQLMKKAPMMGY